MNERNKQASKRRRSVQLRREKNVDEGDTNKKKLNKIVYVKIKHQNIQKMNKIIDK